MMVELLLFDWAATSDGVLRIAVWNRSAFDSSDSEDRVEKALTLERILSDEISLEDSVISFEARGLYDIIAVFETLSWGLEFGRSTSDEITGVDKTRYLLYCQPTFYYEDYFGYPGVVHSALR
jgi:hypothetical protein